MCFKASSERRLQSLPFLGCSVVGVLAIVRIVAFTSHLFTSGDIWSLGGTDNVVMLVIVSLLVGVGAHYSFALLFESAFIAGVGSGRSVSTVIGLLGVALVAIIGITVGVLTGTDHQYYLFDIS